MKIFPQLELSKGCGKVKIIANKNIRGKRGFSLVKLPDINFRQLEQQQGLVNLCEHNGKKACVKLGGC